MSQVEDIPKTYEEAVVALTRWGDEAGPDDLMIFSADYVGDEVVRIIHVSDELPDTGQVFVVTVGPSKAFPFRSATALATPGQWAKIKAGDNVPGPPDWKFEQLLQLWPRFAL
jgi:hypothetical protein